jgi:hypothetical protein
MGRAPEVRTRHTDRGVNLLDVLANWHATQPTMISPVVESTAATRSERASGPSSRSPLLREELTAVPTG